VTRVFVEGVHALGDRVALASDDARKLVTVLRLESGASIEVIDSSGRAYRATIEVRERHVDAILAGVLERGVEALSSIDLVQAIPKGTKMEYVVEKATELGVRRIVPLRSDRVIGERTGERKTERWQRVAKTAAQQCGRTTIPVIEEIGTWATVLPRFVDYDRVFLPWELASARPLRDVFESLGAMRSALVVIGPEGGFSQDEVRAACDAGAQAISLGRRILRTETAALVTVAALLYARGEL